MDTSGVSNVSGDMSDFGELDTSMGLDLSVSGFLGHSGSPGTSASLALLKFPVILASSELLAISEILFSCSELSAFSTALTSSEGLASSKGFGSSGVVAGALATSSTVTTESWADVDATLDSGNDLLTTSSAWLSLAEVPESEELSNLAVSGTILRTQSVPGASWCSRLCTKPSPGTTHGAAAAGMDSGPHCVPTVSREGRCASPGLGAMKFRGTGLPSDGLRTSHVRQVGLFGGGVLSSCLLSWIQLISAVNSFR